MTSPLLTVYTLTFNCARHLVDSQALAASLLSALPSNTTLPDILALSLQEVAPIANSFLGGSLIEPYLSAIADTVTLAAAQRLTEQPSSEAVEQEQPGEDGLEHVLTRHVGLTALMIFARPETKSRIRWIRSAGVGCGLWQMGNKGAVGARLGIERAETSTVPAQDGSDEFEITFVAAHLAPHEQNVAQRNRDFETIVRNLGFTSEVLADTTSTKEQVRDAGDDEEEERLLARTTAEDESADALGLYDTTGVVFFAGDLNYRTSPLRPEDHDPATYPQPYHSRDSPMHYLNYLSRDQLKQEMAAQHTLQHFSEADITFPPTYKYKDKPEATHQTDSSREVWKWAPHRWPSWCDRILYFPAIPKAQRQSYDALPVQSTSDHRPVALSIAVDMQTRTNFTSPHPLKADFASVRTSAQRLEIVVGVVSYLGLTKEGRTILAGIVAGAIASWYVVHSFL